MQSGTASIWGIISSCRKIKAELSRNMWLEIVKWIFYQFKSDHHVSFGKIGTYGFKIDDKTKQKIPILFYNKEYLKSIDLIPQNHSFILKPVLKINSNLIANNCGNSDIVKEDIDYLFEYVLKNIDKILRAPTS